MIVVCRCRPIDDDAARDPFPRLQSNVRMVPGRPVLARSPRIRRAAPRRNGALGNRGHAVHLVRVVLPDAVEVDRGAVARVMQMVRDVHLDSVTPVRDDGGSREHAVDGIHLAGNAIWGRRDLHEVEEVLPRRAGVG